MANQFLAFNPKGLQSQVISGVFVNVFVV
jgi:hypothetical protein